MAQGWQITGKTGSNLISIGNTALPVGFVVASKKFVRNEIGSLSFATSTYNTHVAIWLPVGIPYSSYLRPSVVLNAAAKTVAVDNSRAFLYPDTYLITPTPKINFGTLTTYNEGDIMVYVLGY